MRTHLVLSVGLLGVGCRAPAPVAPSADVTAAVDTLYQQFSRAYGTLDAELVAGLYAEDALYLAPDADFVRGRADIGADFARMFARAREGGQTLDISFDITRRDVGDRLGYDVGVYTLVRRVDGAEVSRSRGKFVVVLVRGADGRWRFQVDAYNGFPRPAP